MMSDNKSANVGQVSDTIKGKSEALTLSESAAYAGVSTRTIERHATFKNYKTETIIRNSRKAKGFSKEWLDKQFKDVGHLSDKKPTSPTNVGQMSDKYKTTENEAIKDVSLIEELKQDVTFLRKEIEAKNDQLQAKDSQILELISSEQKTKMLLADLQFQQKTLLLDKPTAKQSEKKSSNIWWGLFVLLAATCAVLLYFGVTIVQDFFNKLISNF